MFAASGDEVGLPPLAIELRRRAYLPAHLSACAPVCLPICLLAYGERVSRLRLVHLAWANPLSLCLWLVRFLIASGRHSVPGDYL